LNAELLTSRLAEESTRRIGQLFAASIVTSEPPSMIRSLSPHPSCSETPSVKK
jgi:hypothetical protein